MKLSKAHVNQKGFSLVEVLLAIGITGGLALTVAKLMENSTESVKQVEAKSENINLKNLVQGVLTNSTACTNTFSSVLTPANVTTLSGSTGAFIVVPSIQDRLNVTKYSTASTDLNPLSITSLNLTNYNPTAYTGDLIVRTNFRKSATNTVELKPITIPMNFTFASGVLTTCSALITSGQWSLSGNAGTSEASDFIGTTDTADFNIRVNNRKSGQIDWMTGNTFFGATAGELNTAAANTGFGYMALAKGTYTGAGENTAIGYQTLYNNYLGRQNTTVGAMSMVTNTNGRFNSVLGYSALRFSLAADYNSAVGFEALRASTTGTYNTAFGAGAGATLLNGTRNLFLGSSSGAGVTSSSNKLYIETTTATTPLIGGDFGTRQVSIDGNLTVTGNIVASGTITPSDKKLKENVKPLKHSLDKILQIKGVSYQMKDRKEKDKKDIGFIAQDVKEVYPELVTTFEHQDGKTYSAVNYVGFVAPLVEGIKDLYEMVVKLISSDKSQDLKIKELQKENAQLVKQIKHQQENFEARLKKLEASK